MSQFFMYVLLCKDQTFYTGYTVDLEKRIATHNAGKQPHETTELSD